MCLNQNLLTYISQRKTEDREFFNFLVDDIGIAPVDVVDVVHLGAKVANKIRPVRVQFNNLSHRRSVLGNAKKLHNSSSSHFKENFSTQIFLGKKDRHKRN